MRDIKELVVGGVLGVGLVAAIAALGIAHPLLAGVAVLASLASLLLPPVLLALLLRRVKLRERHAYFRMARPARSQTFPPAAFGNSSGGRNVS
jgi:uncharacterized membrane protein YdfJ with MMPL/SSD domain